MKFGENLKQIRKSKKMSQEQLAEKINVTRQSVSKWENGESYPEMNNILELCKIFNCKLNDLVHADMSDLSLLDEEIVLDVVKFNDKKQKDMKNLCNVIEMIGKIGSIVLMVAIPFVLLVMILIPYVVNNIVIDNNEITFKTANIKIVDNNKIEIHDVLVGEFDTDLYEIEVIKVLENNSNLKIISFFEGAMLFLLIDLVIMIIILKYVEKLFNNIKNNKTPFILDNVKFIKRIAYLMIALILITPISETLINTILCMSEESGSVLDLMSILEILIIFSTSYIFEYGYELQKDSKSKIYN